MSSVGQTFGGRKTFNAGATMIGLASLEPVLTCQLASGATSSARLQEWRDVLGINTLAYIDATPKFTMLAILPDVDYPGLPPSRKQCVQVG